MTFPIGGISIPSFPTVSAVGATPDVAQPPAVSAADNGFADVLTGAIDQLQGMQSKANDLGLQAATGDLRDVTDYLIASNEAKLTTEMVVTIKNQAVAAFTEIMRMPI